MKKLLRSNIRSVLLIAAFFLCLVIAGFGVSLFYTDISWLEKHNPTGTSFMEYRMNEWKSQGRTKKISRKWVPLSEISPYLVSAVTIAEDDRFWEHEGIDVVAIREAIERDIRKKKFHFGGSTITQQLVKNLYLSPSKNPVRKIREAILAWRMERILSKKRILELYLNVIEWGDGIFGIEAASRYYFGKSASSLEVFEATRLAVVLPNPRKMDPTGTSAYVAGRSMEIFDIMVKRGIVDPTY